MGPSFQLSGNIRIGSEMAQPEDPDRLRSMQDGVTLQEYGILSSMAFKEKNCYKPDFSSWFGVQVQLTDHHLVMNTSAIQRLQPLASFVLYPNVYTEV